MIRHAEQLARSLLPTAFTELAKIAKSSKNDLARVRAIELILERGMGRVPLPLVPLDPARIAAMPNFKISFEEGGPGEDCVYVSGLTGTRPSDTADESIIDATPIANSETSADAAPVVDHPVAEDPVTAPAPTTPAVDESAQLAADVACWSLLGGLPPEGMSMSAAIAQRLDTQRLLQLRALAPAQVELRRRKAVVAQQKRLDAEKQNDARSERERAEVAERERRLALWTQLAR